jgi:hypothetical protein
LAAGERKSPNPLLTGHAWPRALGLRARGDGSFIVTQAAHEPQDIAMKSTSVRIVITLGLVALGVALPTGAKAQLLPGEVRPILDFPMGDKLEGIARDSEDGAVYVGNRHPVGSFQTSDIWKINDDGKIDAQFSALQLAPMPTLDGLSNGLLGLVTHHGDIFAALDSDVGESHGVYKISKRGTLMEPLAGSANILTPNALAFDDADNLYVTDSKDGSVWRFDPHNIDQPGELWVQHELLAPDPNNQFGLVHVGANGIAFANDSLFVANTSKNSIVRIGIDADGDAELPQLFAAGLPLFTVDGIVATPDEQSLVAAIPGFAVLSALTQFPFSPIVQVDTQTGQITPVPVSDADKALFETPVSLTASLDGLSVFVANGGLPADDVFAELLGIPQPGASVLEVGIFDSAVSAAAAAVPEPSTALLLILAAGPIALRVQTKRRCCHVHATS